MSRGFTGRVSRVRPIAALFVGLLAIWAVASAEQVSGKLINRSGTPQAGCQIEFFLDANRPPTYRVTSNNAGNFFLNDPIKGAYTVIVRQGQQHFSVSVTVDAYGLHPSSLIATW